MKFVIKKTGGEYSMNGVTVSEAAVKELLFAMFKSPQLDECVKTLMETGELTLELNHAEAVAADEAVRKAAKGAMGAILDANNTVSTTVRQLADTYDQLSKSAAELLQYC